MVIILYKTIFIISLIFLSKTIWYMVLVFNSMALQRENPCTLLTGEVYRLTIPGQESHTPKLYPVPWMTWAFIWKYFSSECQNPDRNYFSPKGKFVTHDIRKSWWSDDQEDWLIWNQKYQGQKVIRVFLLYFLGLCLPVWCSSPSDALLPIQEVGSFRILWQKPLVCLFVLTSQRGHLCNSGSFLKIIQCPSIPSLGWSPFLDHLILVGLT